MSPRTGSLHSVFPHTPFWLLVILGCLLAWPGAVFGVCVGGTPDGVIADSEECDDNNLVAGDGCSATCTIEPGYACVPTSLPDPRLTIPVFWLPWTQNDPDWRVTADRLSAVNDVNSKPTIFFTNVTVAEAKTFTMTFRTLDTDDDLGGVVIGIDPTIGKDDPAQRYLILSWKGPGTQAFAGSTARSPGLAIGYVHGGPMNGPDMWDMTGPNVTFLKQITTTAWVKQKTHTIAVTYFDTTRLTVSLDGVQVYDVTNDDINTEFPNLLQGGLFPSAGVYGLFNASQNAGFSLVTPKLRSTCFQTCGIKTCLNADPFDEASFQNCTADQLRYQLDLNEQCDDGNINDGDGCSSSCKIEPGSYCTAPDLDAGTPSNCTAGAIYGVVDQTGATKNSILFAVLPGVSDATVYPIGKVLLDEAAVTVTALAMDAQGKLFGFIDALDAGKSTLMTISPSTGKAIPVGSGPQLGEIISAAAFDRLGRLWGVSTDANTEGGTGQIELLQVDPATGLMIGNPVPITFNGQPLNYPGAERVSLAFDGRNLTILGVDNTLYRVALGSGEVTHTLGVFSNLSHITGLVPYLDQIDQIFALDINGGDGFHRLTFSNQTSQELQADVGTDFGVLGNNDAGPGDLTRAPVYGAQTFDGDGDGLDDFSEDPDGDGLTENGDTSPLDKDTDGDGIPDGLDTGSCLSGSNPDSDDGGVYDGFEQTNGTDPCDPTDDYGCPNAADPNDCDGDGLPNIVEDKNRNGKWDVGETDFNNPDTDGDGLKDGEEDINKNGIVDQGETDPLNPDTDGGGVKDGVEVSLGSNPLDPSDDYCPYAPNKFDCDGDGLLNTEEDKNKNGIVDIGETNWNKKDTDDGGIDDKQELTNGTNPLDPNDDYGCPNAPDPRDCDGDGLPNIVEDKNRNRIVDQGETDWNNPDTDGDGLKDGEEDTNKNGVVDVGETDPLNPDTDGDGLKDGDEVKGITIVINGNSRVVKTDPLDKDTDDDGLNDNIEVGIDNNGQPIPDANNTDPTITDTDQDGLQDGQEDFNKNGRKDENETDPNDPDTDKDGILDGVEVLIGGTDPLNKDTDGDCIDDGVEDADKDGIRDAGETDPTKSDTDGDGLNDGVETGMIKINGVCTPIANHNPTDPKDPDTDGDGILDGVEDANHNGVFDVGLETDPTKKDTDGDGLPDGVEDANRNGVVDFGETNPRTKDTDSDGVDDNVELGLQVDGQPIPGANKTNPTNPDTDGDGLTDGEEDKNGNGKIDVGESDPRKTDSDGDGLSDYIELMGQNPTDPTNPDTDNDGIPDGVEDSNKNGKWDEGLETDPNKKDTDGDGLTDGEEDKNHNGVRDVGETDPRVKDTDGDGLSDGDEVNNHGTNPLLRDTDGDGLDDDFELDAVNGSGTNPLKKDTDGDGIPDGVEFNSQSGLDPNKKDTDDDGVDDGKEDKNKNGFIDAGETDPNNPDTDGDGLKDGEEDRNGNGQVDKGETDPLNPDTDHDGLKDGDEDRNHNGVVDKDEQGNPIETDPLNPDSDGDGLKDGDEDRNGNGKVDVDENGRPLETDPLNADSDGDGIPDGVEDKNGNGKVDPGETDPRNADSDGDGIPDGVEDANHNGVVDDGETDPTKKDSDKDGIPDGTEDANHNGVVDPGETDPRNPDSDGDGIRDGVEDRNFNGVVDPGETDPRNPDSDGDGIPDGIEDANHNGIVDPGETDPTNPDTDGDGIPDGVELGVDAKGTPIPNANKTNPLLKDTDGDGLSDGDEDANKNGRRDPDETDPNLSDTDGDGLTDGLERGVDPEGNPIEGANKTNPLKSDSDNDGLPDGLEDANKNGKRDEGETDPNNPDSDGDGLRDGTEDVNKNGKVDPGETDPNNPDSDNDGLKDGIELGFNPDGTLNPDANKTDPLSPDSDRDGLLDGEEDSNNDGVLSLNETNPNDPDTDKDGIIDGVELGKDKFGNAIEGAAFTNPLNPDTDNDGLLDGFEDRNRNGKTDLGESNPTLVDTDGDGYPDGEEVRGLGTDPTVPTSVTFKGGRCSTNLSGSGSSDNTGSALLFGLFALLFWRRRQSGDELSQNPPAQRA